MLDDNLNKKKLAEMIGTARFNALEEFSKMMRPKLLEELFLEEDRLKEISITGSNQIDFYIYDALTKREVLMIIGLKISKLTPALTSEDLHSFHQVCLKMKSLYGTLLTETEVYFFEYMNDQPLEIKEIKPLNHIEYDFEREMTVDKWKDFIIHRKKLFIGLGLFFFLLISASLANSSVCKRSGIIKGEVSSSGEKFYYTPDQFSYNTKKTGDQSEERRFCNEKQARRAGWLKGR